MESLEHNAPMKRLKDLSPKSIDCIPSNLPIREAVKAMQARGASAVALLNGDTPCGVLTDEILGFRVFTGGKSWDDNLLSEILDSKQVVFSEEDAARQVLKQMIETRQSHILVQGKDGTLLGMLHLNDFIAKETAV